MANRKATEKKPHKTVWVEFDPANFAVDATHKSDVALEWIRESQRGGYEGWTVHKYVLAQTMFGTAIAEMAETRRATKKRTAKKPPKKPRKTPRKKKARK